MTPRNLMDLLSELFDEEVGGRPLGKDAFLLTVPQLMHIKAGLDRALLDAISDDETPCPHDGTRWKPTLDPENRERCGQCGRIVEEIKA